MANENGITDAYRVVVSPSLTVVGFASLEDAARWVSDTLKAGHAYRIERSMGGEWVLALGNDAAGVSLGVGL